MAMSEIAWPSCMHLVGPQGMAQQSHITQQSHIRCVGQYLFAGIKALRPVLWYTSLLRATVSCRSVIPLWRHHKVRATFWTRRLQTSLYFFLRHFGIDNVFECDLDRVSTRTFVCQAALSGCREGKNEPSWR